MKVNTRGSRALALLLLLSTTLLNSGCGISRLWGGGDKEVPLPELPDIKNPLALDIVWRRDVGKGGAARGFVHTPLVRGDTLLVPAGGDTLVALERNTGSELWERDLDFDISAGVASDGKLIVVPGTGGQLQAVDFVTGDAIWDTNLSSEVLSQPMLAGDRVIARTADGSVHALDLADGKSLWRYDRTVPDLSLRGDSRPLISGGTVVAGLANGYLVGLGLTDGQLRWEARVAAPSGRSELERMVDIDSTPVELDSIVFATSFQGQMAAVGSGSGDVLWERDFSGYGDLAADWQFIYAADADGWVWALDSRNGRAAWSQDSLLRRTLSGTAVLGDYVLVGDHEGQLHLLSVIDGALRGRYRLAKEAPITAQPVVVQDTAYVISGDGELAALRIAQ